MLSVIMLNVIMLSVVAPFDYLILASSYELLKFNLQNILSYQERNKYFPDLKDNPIIFRFFRTKCSVCLFPELTLTRMR